MQTIVGSPFVMMQEPMSRHTSFKIGGVADCLVEPAGEEQIRQVLHYCRTNSVPFMVLGRGSNILVSDNGIRGIVIKIGSRMNRVTVKGNTVTAQAGITMTGLSRILLQHSLAGFEFAGGIPGTLGGGLVMNAGAYGGELKDIVKSCSIINKDGITLELTQQEMEMGYRCSRMQKTGEIVLEATLTLSTGVYQKMKLTMDDYWHRRLTRQPYYLPSGGSVFKRPEGCFAGKLIEDAGLKGVSVGGAMVSELHAGFIVNTGNATAQDVVSLMALIRERVKEQFGVELDPELRVIGDR